MASNNPLLCHNGHPVTQLKVKERFYRGRTGLHVKTCAICQKTLERKSSRWRCAEKCSYYCCEDCYDKRNKDVGEDVGSADAISASAMSALPLIAILASQDPMSDSDTEIAPSKCDACKPCAACFASCLPGLAPKAKDSSNSYSQLEQLEAQQSDLPLLTSPAPEIMEEVERGRTRAMTMALFSETDTAPAIGGLDVMQPHSDFLLPPEVVLFEPTAKEMGQPCEPGSKKGKRSIFLNTKLTKLENEGLQALHDALEEENLITMEGDSEFPLYVRLHALRILQQARFDPQKAVAVILTHLNMRVKFLPLKESDVLRDLSKGLMYWHGRDRKCRPCLVWRLEKMDGFDKERAIKLVLYVLEYAVRFALVPGRVENWILIADLEGVGLGSASSANREIAKTVAVFLEQVFCGRNYRTYIMSLPWVIRSFVSSFIPEDKKEKVQFAGGSDMPTVMAELFEPHQLEQRYGGTAPNLKANQTYPFHFFPNATGQASNTDSAEKSLHKFTDRTYHSGHLWDESSPGVKGKWMNGLKGQTLTPAAVRDLEGDGHQEAKACKDMQTWLDCVNPEEAARRKCSDGQD